MNINDIAKLAGVSASTVSKVMNGKDKDISEKTRKNVLRVIKETNYIPYFKYWEKEGLKNHLVGLIIQKENREREELIPKAVSQAEERGYGLVIKYVDHEDEIPHAIEEMIKLKVVGVLIDSHKRVFCGKLEDTSVYFTQTSNFDKTQKSTFYYRLSQAGRMATERLMQEGHKKIACIVKAGDKSIVDGYKTAMQSLNYPIQQVWIYETESMEDLEHFGIRQCLSENVTAVVCGSSDIVCCVWKILERIRMVIPDSLSIISVGDNRMMELLGYGITSVKLPSELMMESATNSLIDMIEEEKKAEVMKQFAPTIVERKSIVPPAQEKQGEGIVVVGSMNMDITTEVSRIPVNGETQLADRLWVFPGGKGGNQAVGAGKLGGQVYMIGRLGNDLDGKQLFANLVDNHVHMDGVFFDKSLPSGKAYINVDKRGESTIVVYQGANRNLNIRQINKCKYLFQKSKYCLLSMEVPEEIVDYTIRICKRNHTQVILKPSGMDKIKEDILKDITYFVPNENELNVLVPEGNTVEEKAEILRNHGIDTVIVTLGERGCYLKNEELSMYFQGSGLSPVDTTGGADSFISALAVYLSEGKELVEAIGFAIYASGITVTRYGVQPALPDRKAVDIYEDEIYSRYNHI